MKFPSFYFPWLQKDNPTGLIDTLPELKNGTESSVPGLYCVGDLTGIPLIKLAAESGYDIMEKLHRDTTFQQERIKNTDQDMLDLIICGAGPAGLSACIQADKLDYKGLVFEASQKFNTIVNFPTGKPIYVTPEHPPMRSALKFSDGTKETLLDELYGAIKGKDLHLREGETVKQIIKEQEGFSVKTSKGSYKALRVILAIGKNGNARMLGVPGEKLPKVFTRLIDPGEFKNKNILVVGGGDSAIEAANALAQAGNQVTLSYRQSGLSRPKEQNLSQFNKLTSANKITPVFSSTVKEITNESVVLHTVEGEKTIPNDAVFGLIGTEFPIKFFRRSSIRLEGEKRPVDYIKFAALLFFAGILYFGKKAPATGLTGLQDFITLPSRLLKFAWPQAVVGFMAWLCLIGLVLCALPLVIHISRNASRYLGTKWDGFKYLFYLGSAVLFAGLFMAFKYAGKWIWPGDMGSWYTLIYSLTIVVFGLRRMYKTPTTYVKRQTWTLMAFQVIPLCVLPMFVLPWLGNNGLLGEWVMNSVFPGQSYWRAYGIILAWPLFIHNLALGEPTLFWLITGLAQTFVIIPWLNYKWGKGAYCGWICSCGALAETLGDEYRTKAPHGPKAKKWDNAGQVVLWFAAAVTLLALASGKGPAVIADQARHAYEIIVDIIFAGVLGVGVYFFMSGRVWCRFFCPLAALMHIYTRFSLYRIMSNKKRCISCNICTKVCHMGIDVMGYANKGIPMNDVECVRCSACVVNCPMQVLTFGTLEAVDLDNTSYKKKHIGLTKDWGAGLPDADLRMLLKEEKEK